MTDNARPLTDDEMGIGKGAAASKPATPKPLSDAEMGLDAPARGLKGWGQDIAGVALNAAISVPELAVGLADIPTGGRVGKFLENEGGSVGFRPKQAKEFVNENIKSDASREAHRKFQEADGIGAKFATAVQNPSLVLEGIGESLGAMGAGGVAARGLMAATKLGQMGAKGAAAAGALGEGAAMAGSQAEAIRQETKDGLLTPGQAGLSLATGAIGAAVGFGGNKLAQRLGIGDVDIMLAQGKQGMAKQFADDAAGAAMQAANNPLVQQAAAKGIPRQVIEGAITEGLLEELPQSVAEQVLQNIALDKDWHEDLDAAIVMGVLSGGTMGAGAAGYRGAMAPKAGPKTQEAQAVAAQALADAAADPSKWTTSAGAAPDATGATAAASAANSPVVDASDFSTSPGAAPEFDNGMQFERDIDTPGLSLAENPVGQPMGPDMPAAAPAFDTSGLSLDGQAPKPSVAMGLRSGPAAGGLENAAAMAVDSGAHQQLTGGAAAVADMDGTGLQDQVAGNIHELDYDHLSQLEKDIYDWEMSQDDMHDDSFASLADMDDSDIPFFDRPSNVSEADFLRSLGATNEEINNATDPANQPASPTTGDPSAAAAQANEPRGAQASIGTDQAAPSQPGDSAAGANVATLAQLNRKKLAEMSTDELHQLASLLPTEHARQQKIQKAIQTRAAQAQPAINQGAKNDGNQTDQAQQGSAQPAQAGPAQASQPAAQGLSDGGAPTQDNGRQAGSPVAAQGQAAGQESQQRAQRVGEAGQQWTRMTAMERQAAVARAQGIKPVIAKNLPRAQWEALNVDVQRKLADVMAPAAPQVEGNPAAQTLAKAAPNPVETQQTLVKAEKTPAKAAAPQAKAEAQTDAAPTLDQLEQQLRATNDELENQGRVQNAATRTRADQLESAIEELKHPGLYKASGQVARYAKAMRLAIEYKSASDSEERVLRATLKNAGVVEPHLSTMTNDALAALGVQKPAAAPEKPADYGASNKLVSQSRADELRAKLREKAKNHLFGGLDTEMMAWGTELAVFHMEAGVRKFTDLVGAMASDLGTTPAKLKPYLRSWYNGARDMMEDHGLSIDGMDSPETVRAELNKLGAQEAAPQNEQREATNERTTVQGDGTQALEPVAAAAREGIEGSGRAGADATGSGDQRPAPGAGADGAGVQSPRSGGSRTERVHPAEAGDSGALRKPGRVKKTKAAAAAEKAIGADTRPAVDGEPTSAPNIPAADFQITDDLGLGKGGEVAKFNDNLDAIRTLKALEEQNRRATPEEQALLARYVGWGGLANAFPDPLTGQYKAAWEARGKALRELLDDAEYAAARRSTRNAHYTSKPVVQAMWRAVERLGFKGGLALETSMGVGNFLGLKPQGTPASFVGIEYDSLTARLAQALYPQATVLHSGFQSVPLADNAFALSIGNPPFGSESLRFQYKPELNGTSIHNQFFRASMDALRPGGIQAMVVSRFLMDAKDKSTRLALAKQAKLVAAIRLPDTAFKENARTEVVTDIIILQKLTPGEQAEMALAVEAYQARGDKFGRKTAEQQALADKVPAWVETADVADPLGGDAMTVNGYFRDNKDNILGVMERSGSMQHGADLTVRLDDAASLERLLTEAVDRLPQNIQNFGAEVIAASEQRHKSMSDALRIALSGQEAGHVQLNRDGVIERVVERETPEGGIEMGVQAITAESPWSDQLLQDEQGRWYKTEVVMNEAGKPVKLLKSDGKASRNNLTQRVTYDTEAQVPDTLRLGKTGFERLRAAVGLRDALKRQIVLETADAAKGVMDANRKELAKRYEAFVAKFGPVNRPVNLSMLMTMPDGGLTAALEVAYTPEVTAARAKASGLSVSPEVAKRAPILTERVVPKYEPATKAATASDALAITLSERGVVDVDRIAQLRSLTVEEAMAELQGGDKPLVFKDPESQAWETADAYLSGNVRRKLNAAKVARADTNVKALEAVQPAAWGAEDVTVMLGSGWVPPNVYADFAEHLTGGKAKASFSPATNAFSVSVTGSTKAADWSSEGATAEYILGRLLNSQPVVVTYRDANGSLKRDNEATTLAQLKAKEISAEFLDWVFKDGERRTALVDLFNEKFNTRVVRQRDGSHLKLPGKVPDTIIGMRRHQKNVIWRGITDNALLMDHAVGAGKTFAAIARAMERRRMGLSKKPMIVVPNHLIDQWATDVYRLYPGAKVLAAGKKDFDAKRRRRLFGKIATGDWDIVLVPHSSFGFIGIDSSTEQRFLQMEMDQALEAVKDAADQAAEDGTDNGRRKPFGVKEAERLVEKIQTRMDKLNSGVKDRLLTFEQLGVDDLTVDEAHEFKNLYYSSRMTGVRGMGDKIGSRKANDLYNKVRVLQESPANSVSFLTGTPISNSAVEMFTVMRYLAPKQLQEMGLEHFDAWRAQFVEASAAFEPTESGSLKEVTRLGRSWSNMRSLMDLYYEFTDAVSLEDIQQWYSEDNGGKAFPVPKVKGGDRQLVNVQPTQAQEAMLKDVIAGFDSLADMKDPYERNAERLRLMDRARKVSLDVRAVNPRSTSTEENGKLAQASVNIKRIYDATAADKGTQMVFLDRSVPKAKGDDKIIKEYDALVAKRNEALASGDEAAFQAVQESLDRYDANEINELRNAQNSGWNAYQQIKDNLIAAGVPANEIRFIQEANNDEQKQALFDAVNSGKVRVLLGSSQRMGAGTNAQKRLVGLHHIDVTWKPSDIEQREGRIIRQGNELLAKYGEDFEVEILAYATERTVDAKMWDLNATKLKTINGIRKYDGAFSMDFEDADSVSMAEMAALASGNPLLLERVKTESEINMLELQERGFRRRMYGAQDAVDSAERRIARNPGLIEQTKNREALARERIAGALERKAARRVTIEGKEYDNLRDAFGALKEAVETQQAGNLKARYSVTVDGQRLTNKEGMEAAVGAALGDASMYEATINGQEFTQHTAAARELAAQLTALTKGIQGGQSRTKVVGKMLGFDLAIDATAFDDRSNNTMIDAAVSLVGEDGTTVHSLSVNEVPVNVSYVTANLRTPAAGLFNYMETTANRDDSGYLQHQLDRAIEELPSLRERLGQTFPKAEELATKRTRLRELVTQLDGTKAAPAQAVPNAGDESLFAGAQASKAGTTTDRAVMGMVREGQSAQDVLQLIAGTSRNPLNRKVAQLLLKTGANPAMSLLSAEQSVSSKGVRFKGRYNNKRNTLELSERAGPQAEQIFLHEMIHAATMQALKRQGLHSLQMKKLYQHVKQQGGAAGQYGMQDVAEFVAEAFTNPDFQQALRQMSAPPGGTLKSAWDSLVRVIKSILGLHNSDINALSQALDLGVAVMREDMALRKRGVPGWDGDAFAGADQTQTEAFKRWFGDWQNAGDVPEQLEPLRGRAQASQDRGDSHVNGLQRSSNLGQVSASANRTRRITFSGASGPTGADGAPVRLYHGSKADIKAFDLSHPGRKDRGWLGDGVYLSSHPVDAEQYSRAKSGEHGPNVMPLYANVRNPYEASQADKVRLKQFSKAAIQAFTEDLKSKGHDGVVLWDEGGDMELLAFEPTQVKSAIGNNGNFDPKDPDISHFADIGDESYFGAEQLNNLKASAIDQITQTLSHPGKVSIWDKTVGTMRHLAERNPLFKPVFESAQRFIDDVSMLANEAAATAPRLLPRVDSWRDLTKKPISAADNKAVSKPLFEGTLMWARDVDGTPMTDEALQAKYRNTPADKKAQMMLASGNIQEGVLKMWKGLPIEQYEKLIATRFDSTVLKTGVVWSAKELKDLFNLSEQQISLYQEARTAIDRSIDITARTDMLRLMGEDYADLREQVLQAPTMAAAMALLTDSLQLDARGNPDANDRLMALNNQIVSRFEQASQLMDKGYAPLSRFGKYTVDVLDANGERQYFGMFESQRESNLMKLKMASAFPGATITQGTMSEQAFKLFQGITPESLEQFGEMLGLKADGDEAQDKAFQAYLQLSKNNHSALKRLIHRKGIDGYSEDVGRVLASFVYSNARLGARGLNAGTMEKAVEAIPKEQGELRDVAMGLRNYISDPQEEGQAVRGMLFAQYLGGSVASAFVNTTQPFSVTLPWLTQFGGMKKAASHLSKALKDMGTKGFKYESDLAQALQEAEDDGTVSPQEVHQLMAQARGAGGLRSGDGTKAGEARAAAANGWERVKVAWGQPFALAEQFNRRSTFIASYRLAKEQKLGDPAEFARKAVLETQFLYSKANKMRFARGAVGGTLMTFKTYSVSYLELMQRMWTQGGPEGKRAVAWSMAMLLLMGGAGGLPFMEDAEDLIDAGAQMMGYNFSTKRARQEFLGEILGQEVADFMEQGLSGLPGAPIDVSGRLGMGNLIPGTGLALQKQSRERDLMELAGPAGDLVKRGFTGLGKLLTGDVAGAALEVSPTAVRNAAKGVDMAASGIYKDTKGYKVMDVTLGEALAKAVGFQPKSVAEDSEATGFKHRTKSFYIQTSADIKAQWAQALFNKDDAALQRVRDRLAAWNSDNPDLPIVVKVPDIMKRVREMGKDREQRINDTAPKALRQQFRDMAGEANR